MIIIYKQFPCFLTNVGNDFISAIKIQSTDASSSTIGACDKMTEEIHVKQMDVLEKTNKMLDIEIAKLELEMKLIEKQMRALP